MKALRRRLVNSDILRFLKLKIDLIILVRFSRKAAGVYKGPRLIWDSGSSPGVKNQGLHWHSNNSIPDVERQLSL
jgi:hypothetical protein